VYLRTGDLSQSGEEISVGAFRNSALPESPEKAPPLLAQTLAAAFAESGSGTTPIAVVVSPEFEGTRAFSAGTGDRLVLLAGYYNTERALLVFPDGRGFFGVPGSAPRPLSLPALPEGYAYTGAVLSGDVIITSWEEQQDSGIGAAGFMVVNIY
jgi:hypothetical protein